jgi:hypothetical protein
MFVQDDPVEFVPGSHDRGDTEEEHAVRKVKWQMFGYADRSSNRTQTGRCLRFHAELFVEARNRPLLR